MGKIPSHITEHHKNKLGLEESNHWVNHFKAPASSGLKHVVLEERQLNDCTSAITAVKVETEGPS